MTPPILSRIIILLASIIPAFVHCQTTPPPAANFVGYYIHGGTTEPITAIGTWSTVGPYARDCPTGTQPCPMPTGCSSNTLMYSGASSLPCGTNTCFAMTIYAASPDVAPTAMNFLCAANWAANTVYRNIPAATSASSLSPSLLSSSFPSPTISSTASATSTTSSTPDASSTPGPTPNKSKAWIAGPVIGGLIGIALLAGLMFWLGGKRKAHQQQPHAQQGQSEQHPKPYDRAAGYSMQYGNESRGNWGYSKPSELPDQQNQHWEMAAGPHQGGGMITAAVAP